MLRVIDIETTGTDPATDKICEIASADLSQTAVTTCRSHVVNPGVTMPPQASAVAPIHTRFDALEWFVWDAEHPLSDLNHAEVIRQAETLEEALRGL
jgi:hypothetical protein